MKTCTKCKVEKEGSQFRVRLDSKDGLNYWCKNCESVENIKRYTPKQRKDKVIVSKEETQHLAKVRMLMHRYNLPFEDYEALYKKQNGCCKICNNPKELGGRKGLHVDHCHKTGEVRGLLCRSCNSAIGQLRESKNILDNVIAYLKL